MDKLAFTWSPFRTSILNDFSIHGYPSKTQKENGPVGAEGSGNRKDDEGDVYAQADAVDLQDGPSEAGNAPFDGREGRVDALARPSVEEDKAPHVEEG
jgi:hypothetical protein